MGWTWADVSASILIGLVPAGVGVLPARETKDLQMGEGANREVLQQIRAPVTSDEHIPATERPLTLNFGPVECLAGLESAARATKIPHRGKRPRSMMEMNPA